MEQNITNIEIGPQYSKDNPFAARMRFHQSWYRARVLRVPFGHGPRKNSPSMYGNFLTQVDGEQGFNFFTPQLGERIFMLQNNGWEKIKALLNLIAS